MLSFDDLPVLDKPVEGELSVGRAGAGQRDVVEMLFLMEVFIEKLLCLLSIEEYRLDGRIFRQQAVYGVRDDVRDCRVHAAGTYGRRTYIP